jgi:hypothetical protein
MGADPELAAQLRAVERELEELDLRLHGDPGVRRSMRAELEARRERLRHLIEPARTAFGSLSANVGRWFPLALYDAPSRPSKAAMRWEDEL